MNKTHLAGDEIAVVLHQIDQALNGAGAAAPALRTARQLLAQLHQVSAFVRVDSPHQLEAFIDRACMTAGDDVVLRDFIGRTWVGTPSPGGPVLRRAPAPHETASSPRSLSTSCLALPVRSVADDAFPMLVLCAPVDPGDALTDAAVAA